MAGFMTPFLRDLALGCEQKGNGLERHRKQQADGTVGNSLQAAKFHGIETLRKEG